MLAGRGAGEVSGEDGRFVLCARAGSRGSPALGTGTWTGKILPPAGLKAAGWLTLLKWSPAEKYWAFEADAPVAVDGVFSFPGPDAGAEYSLLDNPGTDVSTGYAPVQTLGGSMLDQLSKSSAKAVEATGGPQTVNFPLVRGVAVKGKVSLAARGSRDRARDLLDGRR